MVLDRFRAALAVENDATRAAHLLADNLLGQGSGGTVGFLYATDRLKSDLAPIVDILSQRTRVPNWVGTFGVGGYRRQSGCVQ